MKTIEDFVHKPKKNIIFERDQNGTHRCSEEELKIWKKI
jgi:hypothetical protein